MWVGSEQKRKVEGFFIDLDFENWQKIILLSGLHRATQSNTWKKSEYVMMQKIVPDNQTHAITTFCI